MYIEVSKIVEVYIKFESMKSLALNLKPAQRGN